MSQTNFNYSSVEPDNFEALEVAGDAEVVTDANGVTLYKINANIGFTATFTQGDERGGGARYFIVTENIVGAGSIAINESNDQINYAPSLKEDGVTPLTMVVDASTGSTYMKDFTVLLGSYQLVFTPGTISAGTIFITRNK